MDLLTSKYLAYHLANPDTKSDFGYSNINWLHKSFNKEFICFDLISTTKIIREGADIYVNERPSYYKVKKALKILSGITVEFLDGKEGTLHLSKATKVNQPYYEIWPVLFCAIYILVGTQTTMSLGLHWDHLFWLKNEIVKRMKQYHEANKGKEMKPKPDCLKEPEELENLGDVHYEIVGYARDMVEVIGAPLNIEDALEMAINQCGWPLEEITVIRKVCVEEVYLPNARLIKKRPSKR